MSADSQVSSLRRGLKARHMSMIAIGGCIGTGLFMASGAAIHQAGPGGALLAYASLHLTPLAKAENKALTDATVNRVSADADLKRLTAERARLKLEKEQGLLMPRAQYEEDLAARAMFFKSEVDSFGFRKAGEIIALVNGDESKLPDLLKWWAAQTADWMDAWASDRQFAASDEDIEELGED